MPLNLQESSYRWAIKHLLKESDTDLFPRPYELTIIQDKEEELVLKLVPLDISQYKWNAPRRFLVPKDNLSYRNATQLHPVDSIVLGAILYEYGNQIESKRAPETKVFSYRFKPTIDGKMYANLTAWDDFWDFCRNEIADFDSDEEVFILNGVYEYVVTCDISDFYNQIYLHAIENQLIACGIPNQVKNKISDLIKTTTQSSSRGIPVGPHSSHILAEMSLIPIDATLELRGIPFVRYVDDFVIFCKDQKEARIRVLQIAEILDKEQRLMLQRQKTKELKAIDFLKYSNRMLIEEPIYEIEKEIIEIIRNYTGGNAYTKINLAIINVKDLAVLSETNITNLLEKYLQDGNYERLRWLYRRLAQVGIPHAIRFSIENFENLIPAINDMCLYISSCAPNYKSDWTKIGDEIIELLDDPIIKENPFYQISLLNLFVYNKELNHIGKLIGLYKTKNEEIKRKVLLASMHYDNASWIHQLKEEQGLYSEWTRRAYLIATKSLPPEQKKFLHRDIKITLTPHDILEHIILLWAE